MRCFETEMNMESMTSCGEHVLRKLLCTENKKKDSTTLDLV